MDKKKEAISDNWKKLNITLTIKHLNLILKRHKENPIDKFLQKEISRLKKEKEKLI